MATPRPAMYGRYHVYPLSVRYIHAAYATSSWPAAATLCASLSVLMTWFVSCNTHLRADSVNVNLCLD